MSAALLEVLHAGPQVTVQDAGRPGHMRFGVPASGPMDRKSLIIANTALGNPPGQTGIEVSRAGLTLRCTLGAATLAAAGGGFVLQSGQRRLGSWCTLTLRAGETLDIRPGPWGSWVCLAMAGKPEAAGWLGSSATHAASGLGGGALAAGQVIAIADARVAPWLDGLIPCPVLARPRHVLRCVAGPQQRFFSPEVLATFADSAFTLTDAVDRMGQRLRGPALAPGAALQIPSEPILRGAVQVSGDGVATVLLADHQTTGGYPKIATVLGDDVDGLVQCRPRDTVRFRLITAGQAVAAARAEARQFAAYLQVLAQAVRSP